MMAPNAPECAANTVHVDELDFSRFQRDISIEMSRLDFQLKPGIQAADELAKSLGAYSKVASYKNIVL